MGGSAVERYLLLGLRLDRHVEGTVDAYFGPPELRETVAAEEPADPNALVAEADALLGEVADGWLRDQLVGVRTFAGVLAGEELPFADEVEGCYGVRPEWTDESVFAAAHERLEALLPGPGALAERYQRWQQAALVPEDRIERTLAVAVEGARAAAAALVDLPADEEVEVEIVRDVPWLGFCEYLGGLRSRIAVNVGMKQSALELIVLVAHETYPGHHVERVRKEQTLVRGRGLLEESIVLVPTPQSLVSEGIATLAPWLVLESDHGAAIAGAVAREAGVELDLEHALAVHRAHEPCVWAEVNASLLLHDRAADEAEVEAYLRRWALMDDALAKHLIRFLREPTSRTYLLTYAAGHRLCGAYVRDDPARFRHLLGEQVRVSELVEAAG